MSNEIVHLCLVADAGLAAVTQAVESLSSSAGCAHVVTVIDNASSDGTREYLQEAASRGLVHRTVFLEEQVSRAEAANIAWLLEPDAAYYVCCDSGLAAQKQGWLAEMVDVARAVPDLGVLGYNVEGVSYPSVEMHGVRISPKNGRISGCVLIPRTAHERIGFWSGGEDGGGDIDDDLCVRAVWSGLLTAYMKDERAFVRCDDAPAQAVRKGWRCRFDLLSRYVASDTFSVAGVDLSEEVRADPRRIDALLRVCKLAKAGRIPMAVRALRSAFGDSARCQAALAALSLPVRAAYDPKDIESIVAHIASLLGKGRAQEAYLLSSAMTESLPENASLKELCRKLEERAVGAYRAPETASFDARARENGTYVRICMVTYNRLDFTVRAIEALRTQTTYPYLLTVIDNASSDGSREWLTACRDRGEIDELILLPENVGVGRAANIVWSKHDNEPYFLKLDNDMVALKPHWLSEMVMLAELMLSAGVIGCSVEPRSYAATRAAGTLVRVKGGTLGGACVLIPKRTHDLLGDWCDEYGLYGEEDADYGHRVCAAGLLNVYLYDEDHFCHLPAGKAAVIDTKTFVAQDGKEELEDAAYRAWKDAQRKKNLQAGLFSRNVEGYFRGTRALFFSSRVRSSADAVGDTNPGHSAKLKILYVATGNPFSACPMLRLCSPLKVLHECGLAECRTVVFGDDKEGRRDCADAATWADVIAVQRLCSWDLVSSLIGPGLATKAIVYEIDDDLLGVGKDHVLYERIAANRETLLRLVRSADAVTVTTGLLAEKMREHNAHLSVLPNFIDENVWPREAAQFGDRGMLTIGYAGTFTHQADIAFAMRLLERLRMRYPGRLRFAFFGCAPKDAVAAPDTEYIDGGLDYAAYAQRLRAARFDIAIAPLEDTPFNRVKSNIKYLEYARCRIAGVYARLDPYTCVREGETGLCASGDPEDWFAKICMLVDDASLRRRIVDAAYADVEKKYMLQTHAAEWLAVYEDALRFVRNGRVAV